MKKVRYLPVSWNAGAAAATVSLFLVIAAGCASGPGVGSPAPLFEAADDSGAELTLEQYTDKVVVLYFWATWCAPCVVSGPAVQGLHEHYIDDQFVIVGKDGRVIHNQVGFAEGDEEKFEALIDAQLGAVNSESRGIH